MLASMSASAFAQTILRNDHYTLDATADGVVSIRVTGMPAQTLTPEFTVLWSDADPVCQRNGGVAEVSCRSYFCASLR